MLRRLPVDITFVDENDRVAYYSRERANFPPQPRSHRPPGSELPSAQKRPRRQRHRPGLQGGNEGRGRILDSTENGPFVHIRYFAVRDDAGAYRGVIEVSQDIAPLRALEGERRLLDW